MKKLKFTSNMLFFFTLLSPIVSFLLCGIIGEVSIFGVAGIVRYSWIMWLFIPIGILSFLSGKQLKRMNQKYRKNYVAALICLPLLLIFGSYRFIFNNISYDCEKIYVIEEQTALNLPKNVKIASTDLENYTISYVKINDEFEKANFEEEINNSTLWESSLNEKIKNILPHNLYLETLNFDYFIFYDFINGKYNSCESIEDYSYIFIAYDCETTRLIVLSE